MIYKNILTLFLITLLLTACSAKAEKIILGPDAQPGNLPDILGDYTVNGVDPRGEEYSGVLAIRAADQPGEYSLRWVITGSLQEGIGKINGNTLEVKWYSAPGMPLSQSGTARYTITVNQELYGNRWVDGIEDPGEENAYPNQ